MKLYIDTNIYTSLVSLTSNIKSLEKLKKLILEKKIELVLPVQTKEEFTKHYEERVNQAKEKLKAPVTDIQIPNELKSKKKEQYSKEEKEIVDKITTVNSDLKKLVEKRVAEFKKHLDAVDKLIKEIFSLAIIFTDDNEIVSKAVIRYAKGLPPKKNDFKFGDSIIWETLKAYIKTESLVIVSADGDFAEPAKKGGSAKINKILKKEWHKHTKKDLSLYPLLGQFLNTVEKTNPISSESIKKEAAQATSVGVAYVSFPNSFVYPNNLQDGSYLRSITSGVIDTGALVSPNGSNGLVSTMAGDASWYKQPTFTDLVSANGTIDLDTKSLFIDGTVNHTSICHRCGKTYSFSLTHVHIANLCADCSKYFRL